MKYLLSLIPILSLLSCAVRETPDLAYIRGDHVHKEEVDIYFGKPVKCEGTDSSTTCVYMYSGKILDSDFNKGYPKGEYVIRAYYTQEHLEKYVIKKR